MWHAPHLGLLWSKDNLASLFPFLGREPLWSRTESMHGGGQKQNQKYSWKKKDFKVFISRSGNDFVTLPSIITSVLMIVIFIIITLVKRYSVSPRSPVKSVRTEQNGGLAVAWREWLRYCLYCCMRVVFPHWELMTINNWGVLLFMQLLFLASSFYSTSIEIWWTAQLPLCLVFLDALARTHTHASCLV